MESSAAECPLQTSRSLRCCLTHDACDYSSSSQQQRASIIATDDYAPTADAILLTHDEANTIWRTACDWRTLCHVQLHYLSGHLPLTPSYHGSLHSESASVLTWLKALCVHGCFTTFSQPAVAVDEFNGYHQRINSPQCAAVSFWTTLKIAQRLLEAEKRRRDAMVSSNEYLHFCITRPDQGIADSSQISTVECSLCCLHAMPAAKSCCVVPITLTPRLVVHQTVRQRLNLPAVDATVDDAREFFPREFSKQDYLVTSSGGGNLHFNRELEAFKASLNDEMLSFIQQDVCMMWCIDLKFGRKELLWSTLVSYLSAS